MSPVLTQSGHRRALAYRKLCGARAAGVSGLWNAETASIATRRLTCIAVPRSITVLVAAAIASNQTPLERKRIY
jgi:hypothetical protein